MTLPGFTAEFGLKTEPSHFQSAQRFAAYSAEVVVPQMKSEFLCGVGIALFIGSIAFVNPFGTMGGTVLMAQNC